MNQWGWELIKEPFVYTEKTLKIKEKKVEMDKLEVLFLSIPIIIQWTTNLITSILVSLRPSIYRESRKYF